MDTFERWLRDEIEDTDGDTAFQAALELALYHYAEKASRVKIKLQTASGKVTAFWLSKPQAAILSEILRTSPNTITTNS